MRAKIAILVLILLVPTLFVAHAGPTDEVSWSKDQNGMISTSPLILDDSIVVKSIDGLTAYSYSGEELWTWTPSQVLLFEISPLYFHAPTNLIVTGWTDGQVTAYHPEDGELAWSMSSDSPMWGITGRIHESQGLLVVPIETGLLWLDPQNGSVTREFTFPDGAIGYRHGATSIVEDDNVWYLVGDEMGRIHRIDVNESSIIAQYNSSRIRDSIHVLDAQQGRYIVASNGIEANTSGLHILDGLGPISSVELVGSIGTVAVQNNSVIVGDANGLHLFICTVNCTLMDYHEGIGSITGEIRIHEVNGSSLVTTPWNVANGHWTAHRIENGTTLVPIWTWYPEIDNWLTAGLDHHLGVWTGGNDAGLLEVKGVSSKSTNASNYELDQEPESTESSLFSPGIMLLIGLGLTGILILTSQRNEMVETNLLRALSLIWLIVVVILAPAILEALTESVTDTTIDADEQDPLWDDFPDSYIGTQVVCIDVPNGRDFVDAQNTSVHHDLTGFEIQRTPHVDGRVEACIGGLEGHTNVESASIEAARLLGLEIQIEDHALGSYLTGIGSFETASGDGGWEYWVNENHALVSIEQHPLPSSSVIHWRFL